MGKKCSPKKRKAQERHKNAKLRARYRRVTDGYKDARRFDLYPERNDFIVEGFKQMIEDLLCLNPKVLQVMVNDLSSAYIPPWNGKYHNMLIATMQSAIFEGTILK